MSCSIRLNAATAGAMPMTSFFGRRVGWLPVRRGGRCRVTALERRSFTGRGVEKHQQLELAESTENGGRMSNYERQDHRATRTGSGFSGRNVEDRRSSGFPWRESGTRTARSYGSMAEFGVEESRHYQSRELKQHYVKKPHPTDYGPRYGSELYSSGTSAGSQSSKEIPQETSEDRTGNRDKTVPWDSDFWERRNSAAGGEEPSTSQEQDHDLRPHTRGGDTAERSFEYNGNRFSNKRIYPVNNNFGSRFQERQYSTFEQGAIPYKDPKNPSRSGGSGFYQGAPYRGPHQADNRFQRSKDKLGTATRILSALNNDEGNAHADSETGLQTREPDQKGLRSAVQKSFTRLATKDGVPLENWKQKMIQKRAKVEAERAKLDAGIDERVYMSEDWRRSRIGWMCKEIPRLDPRQIVKIMNSQIKWVRNRDVSIVCHRLLNEDHFIRAHRVLKWAQQRPWFELDFELFTKMANLLADTGKVGRTRDLFEAMIQHAYVPKESTFSALVKVLLKDGRVNYVEEAWKVYNRMIQFGHYEPPAVVQYSLFKYLTENGVLSLKWIDRADTVFKGIRQANLACTTEMYESLIVLHAVKGDEEKVDSLIEDMKSAGVELSPLIFGAVIRVSSKTGNYLKAEKVFNELKGFGEPDWRYYIALIEAYGKAGLPDKAMGLFQEIETSVSCPKFRLYQAIIEVMAAADQIESTENLLNKLQVEVVKIQTLQSAFNAVMAMYTRHAMFDKVESTFAKMKTKGCRPNRDSYNLQLKAYIEGGFLDKADELYQKMASRECLSPNYKTFQIMIGGYGKAGNNAKVKEVFKLLTERRHPVPEEFQPYVDAAVKPTWIVQAKQHIQPRLTLTQRGTLVGALLGGARITPMDNRSYEVHFEQDANSYRGQVMIKHMYDVFSAWATDTPRLVASADNSDDSSDEGTGTLHFKTMGHVKFLFYGNQYRPEGKPKIPRLVHRWLSPLSLAYWYMYGGRKSSNPEGIILNGSPYSFNELSLVAEALREKTMDCKIKKDDQGFYLILTGESAGWLWKLMEPHIIGEFVSLLKPDDYDPKKLKEGGAIEMRIAPVDKAEEESGSEEESDSESLSDEGNGTENFSGFRRHTETLQACFEEKLHEERECYARYGHASYSLQARLSLCLVPGIQGIGCFNSNRIESMMSSDERKLLQGIVDIVETSEEKWPGAETKILGIYPKTASALDMDPGPASASLEALSRKELREFLNTETGNGKKYTGYSNCMLIERLRSMKPNPPRRRKAKAPSRLPGLDPGAAAAAQQQQQDGPVKMESPAAEYQCGNPSCRAGLPSPDAFCRRCSCCICQRYDDNKDPSLWVVCGEDTVLGDVAGGCGLSCHIGCMLENQAAAAGGAAGGVAGGAVVELDGGYRCPSCGTITGLLGCWRKQLLQAKTARRVDVLHQRLMLARQLLSGSQKFKKLHEFVQQAAEKLIQDIGLQSSAHLGRGLVIRLSCGTQVLGLIGQALETLQSFHPVKEEPQLQEAVYHIQFKEITTNSVLLAVVEKSSGNNVLGYKLWHRKSRGTYRNSPTTMIRVSQKALVTDLHPATGYMFKVVAFSSRGDEGSCEARCYTKREEEAYIKPVESATSSFQASQKNQNHDEETITSAVKDEAPLKPKEEMAGTITSAVKDEPVVKLKEEVESIMHDEPILQNKKEVAPPRMVDLNAAIGDSEAGIEGATDDCSMDCNSNRSLRKCEGVQPALCATCTDAVIEIDLETTYQSDEEDVMFVEEKKAPSMTAGSAVLQKISEDKLMDSTQGSGNDFQKDIEEDRANLECRGSTKVTDSLDLNVEDKADGEVVPFIASEMSLKPIVEHPDGVIEHPGKCSSEQSNPHCSDPAQGHGEVVRMDSEETLSRKRPAEAKSLEIGDGKNNNSNQKSKNVVLPQLKVTDKIFEYCVKMVRWLECQGHIKPEFRMRFFTWFGLKATDQEKRVVSVYIQTMIDDPVGLAGQLMDAFEESIAATRRKFDEESF